VLVIENHMNGQTEKDFRPVIRIKIEISGRPTLTKMKSGFLCRFGSAQVLAFFNHWQVPDTR